MVKKKVGENVHKENLRSCNRYKERVHTKKEKGILTVERRKRGGIRVHTGTTEKRIHLTLKIASDGTSILCRKEGWEKEDGVGLSVP